MSEREHTQWTVVEPAGATNPNLGLWDVETASGINVCSHCTRDHARLIAAAPDLAQAAAPLVEQIKFYEPSCGEDDDEEVTVRLGDLKWLKRALAKATP